MAEMVKNKDRKVIDTVKIGLVKVECTRSKRFQT